MGRPEGAARARGPRRLLAREFGAVADFSTLARLSVPRASVRSSLFFTLPYRRDIAGTERYVPFDQIKSAAAHARVTFCKIHSSMTEAGFFDGVSRYAHSTGDRHFFCRVSLRCFCFRTTRAPGHQLPQAPAVHAREHDGVRLGQAEIIGHRLRAERGEGDPRGHHMGPPARKQQDRRIT